MVACQGCVFNIIVNSPEDFIADGMKLRAQRQRPIPKFGTPCSVYVAFQDIDGGLTKIGVSRDVEARMQGIAAACGFPVSMAASWLMHNDEVARLVEWRVHSKLGRLRRRGEWFACLPGQAIPLVDSYVQKHWRSC
jgi:hypothetical protein